MTRPRLPLECVAQAHAYLYVGRVAHEPSGERLGQVLATAGVTRLQLHRWQREGLLPRPRQRGLGYGRGSDVLYPAGSTKQAVAIRGLLASQRSFDYARWQLWWEGLAIPENQIRRLLEEQLRDYENHRAAVRAVLDFEDAPRRLTERELDERYRRMDEAVAGRLGNKSLRQWRRRTGRDEFANFLLLVNEIATGSLGPGRGQDDVALLVKALGLQKTGEFGALQAICRLQDPVKLRQALARATDNDLRDARSELRALVERLSPLVDDVATMMGRGVAELVKLVRAPVVPLGAQLLGMLVWLSLRESDRMMRVYPIVLEAANSLGAGTPFGEVVDPAWARICAIWLPG